MEENEDIFVHRIICRRQSTPKPFQINDIVIRRNETNYLNNGRVTKTGTCISVMWYHKNADIIEVPQQLLMHYNEWLVLQEKQKQAKNFWNMTSEQQDKIRGN